MWTIGESLYHQHVGYADGFGVRAVDDQSVPVGIELDAICRSGDAEGGKHYVGAAAATAAEPGKGSGPEDDGLQAETALRQWRHRGPPRAARGGAGELHRACLCRSRS